MALLVTYILLITLNLYKRKSKIAFTILLVYLWILFGWSSGNADWHVYTGRYLNYDSLSSMTEPLFTLLIKGGHLLGLDYRGFLVLLSGICLLMIGKTILDFSEYPGFVLALYAIFSFPIDVTQVRFFTASAIIWFGFRYMFLYHIKRKKTDLLKWVISVILASCVHLAVCAVLILLVPLHCKRRTTITVTAIADLLMLLFSGFKKTFFRLISMWSAGKLEIIMSQSSEYTWGTIRFVWFKMLVIFVGFLVVYIGLKYFKVRYDTEFSKNDAAIKNLDFTLDCNIIIMILIGLVTFTTDFYRIQQVVVFQNYFALSAALLPTIRGKARKQNLLIVLVSVVFSVLALYYLVLRGSNYDTVFYPIFYNNVFGK